MASARLERFAVLHHRLNRVSAQRARKPLALSLQPAIHRNSHHVLDHVGINVVQDHQCFALGLTLGGVRGMPFLPQKFGGAQERTCPHLPAHHIRPLVNQHGQIAPRANPLGVCGANDCLRGGPNHQRLGQLLPTGTGYLGDFGREAFDVLGLFHQVAFGNQQREIGVNMTRFFDALVECIANQLPDGVAVRLDHHAAAHAGVFGKLRLIDDVEIPLRVIFVTSGNACLGHAFVLSLHFNQIVNAQATFGQSKSPSEQSCSRTGRKGSRYHLG